jgi:ATP-dependent RNA helicase RhlE
MDFDNLGLIEPLRHAVRHEGYQTPTPIQVQAIPPVIEGRDLLGCAQTGTGKTAAFALPILQRLHAGGAGDHRRRPVRALIVAPTRELAVQIGESFATYGRHTGLRHTMIFGGVKQRSQEQALKRGIDILVATPGRLLDLLNQRILKLDQVEVLVLDEADRMLDMGFIHDIRRVVAQIPADRQTLLFSATMPRAIRSLADSLMRRPVEIRVPAESPAADTVDQALYVVERSQKQALLEHLLSEPEVTRALVFSRTKRGADRVVHRLKRRNITAEAIHSNKSQNARLRSLNQFKTGEVRVLVASDIAARGLDVDDISHVVNYDLPGEAETYVHRIGRTGRAGASGQAVTFCMPDQHAMLRDIERLLGRAIPVLEPPENLPAAKAPTETGAPRQPRSPRRQGARGSRTGGPRKGDQRGGASDSPERKKNNFWRSKGVARGPAPQASRGRGRRR